MLTEKTGIERVQKLYLQMLYSCNFNCSHCFHGTNLRRSERFSLSQARQVIQFFQDSYGLQSVTLLGGEPFIHPEFIDTLAFCRSLGLETVACTNGYRIEPILEKVVGLLDHLRVSVDGVGKTHDAVRRAGSYEAALNTIRFANRLGIRCSVTITIMSVNAGEVFSLAQQVSFLGVKQLKLHQLRLLGNAQDRPDLICSRIGLEELHTQITRIREELKLEILLDDDLGIENPSIYSDSEPETFELERVEIQPDGALYISCKAVGSKSNAFWFDKNSGQLQYHPAINDELAVQMPQVRYVRA
ncbi:MAG: radical SAM protein [Patescibacteria group bacterium]